MKKLFILILTLIMFCTLSFVCNYSFHENTESKSNTENKKITPTVIIETPPDDYIYDFNSYTDLQKALLPQLSDKNAVLQAEQQNYGTVYQNTLSEFTSGSIKLFVPQINRTDIALRNENGLKNVFLLTSELYNLPWIWYRCTANEYDLDVRISYLNVLDSAELRSAKSYLDTLALIAPDAPSPLNYQQYESYKTIYEKEITLSNERNVTAMFSELKDSSKIYVGLLVDNALVVLYADSRLFSDTFWNTFNIAEY